MKPSTQGTECYLILLVNTQLPITFQMCQRLATNAVSLRAFLKDYSFSTIAWGRKHVIC